MSVKIFIVLSSMKKLFLRNKKIKQFWNVRNVKLLIIYLSNCFHFSGDGDPIIPLRDVYICVYICNIWTDKYYIAYDT